MPAHFLEHVEEADTGWESFCFCGWSGFGDTEHDATVNFAHGHGHLLAQKPEWAL